MDRRKYNGCKKLTPFLWSEMEIMNALKRNLLSVKIHIEGNMVVLLKRCNVCATLIR